MALEIPGKEIASHLKYLVKSYDDITDRIEAWNKREIALGLAHKDEKGKIIHGPNSLVKKITRKRITAGLHCPHCNAAYPDDVDTLIPGLSDIQRRAVQDIEFYLPLYDIHEKWLKQVPGIGSTLSAKLILLYYYKFIPICKDCGGDLIYSDTREQVRDGEEKESEKAAKMVCSKCGKKSKGDGIFSYRLVYRNFPTIAKWWKFIGYGVDPTTGRLPKKVKGDKINWSPSGRQTCWLIGDQFNRQTGSPYRTVLDERRKTIEEKHDDWPKNHQFSAAKMQTTKLFLAHFWTVARTLDGLPVSLPYAMTILGHTHYVKPFFWDGNINYVETDEIQRNEMEEI